MKHIYRRFILSAVLVFPVVISAGAQELAGIMQVRCKTIRWCR